MKDESLHLFRDVLLSCEEMNLLGGTMFALDGCKLPSNASKEWSGTLAELRKKKEKIETRVAQLLKEQLQTDQRQDDPPGPQVAGANRQRQVEKLQRKAELIETWLAENQPKLGAAGREKQSNITDNDSATMMTSHGAVQGYNSQALIDGQHPVIVHGGAFGFLGHSLVPHWVVNPNSFVLVGIGGFFAGVAKVPVASIIIACEMCASYTLLVPLMLVSAISYLFLGKTSLYEKQLVTRLASPAHLGEFARGLLEESFVRDAILPRKVITIPESMPFGKLIKVVTDSPDAYYPVVDEQGKMTGILSINDIRGVLFEDALAKVIIAKDVATPTVVRVIWDESLQDALEKMTRINVNELPVVRQEAPNEIIGMIAKRDIISYYYERSLKWR
ncbi:MAG: CBS domain-containing protein [Desulfobaccales bacterium]